MSLSHYAIPNILTSAFRASEGAGQNWGGRRGRGSDKLMFMAAIEKAGTLAKRIIIGELPAERAEVRIDRGGDKITMHFASSCESSMGSSIFLDNSIYSDADDNTASENRITAD